MNRWAWKRSIRQMVRDPESVSSLWSILGLILLIAIAISLIEKSTRCLAASGRLLTPTQG